MSTQANSGPANDNFRYDPNAKTFPTRKELPQVPGTPDGAAWFWGHDDFKGRLNLQTESRVREAAQAIIRGKVVPLNLPLDMPKLPAFGREEFKHEIKILHPGICYDDLYTLNTQSGTQWDGFRHFAHIPSGTFYNNTHDDDIVGPKANENCSIHHWAEHGIVGRALFLDFYSFSQASGKTYDPWTYYPFSYADLAACGRAQGIDIRPESQGGDVKPGDLLLVRGGWTDTYHNKTPKERTQIATRKHWLGPDDPSTYAGLSQEQQVVDWLHDCYFSAVGGDMPSFEAWPSKEKYYLHEYLLACWGVPIGEMFDLEKLAEVCKAERRWWVFITSAPANVHRGVSSHANLVAIL
ncbi:hypothetical protein B7463_g3187, partial [Scytalidium lignicola]